MTPAGEADGPAPAPPPGGVEAPEFLTIADLGRAADVPLSVHAEYFDGRFDLAALATRFERYTALRPRPLVLQAGAGAYVVLTEAAVVVFWNCPERLRTEFLREIADTAGSGSHEPRVGDRHVVVVNAPADGVSFGRISLRRASVEHVSVVSNAIATSVALDHLELAVAESLRRAQPLVARLRDRGGLLGRERSILKTIGFTMSVRQSVLGRLGVLDAPPETWDSETLAQLHGSLRQHFELAERTTALEAKLSFLEDLNRLMVDLLATRSGHRLEWIVILLIVFEVLLGLWEHFREHLFG